MEINLLRPVTPVLRVSRLGHSIGLANQNMTLALDLPRHPADTGVKIICDPGQNYRNDPELARAWLVRRGLVEHLRELFTTMNPFFDMFEEAPPPPSPAAAPPTYALRTATSSPAAAPPINAAAVSSPYAAPSTYAAAFVFYANDAT